MRFSPKTILLSTLIVFLAIPVVLFTAGWIYFAVISETLVSWDTPHSREEALATDFGSKLGLPPSAKDIYALYRSEGTQQNLLYIRFVATSEDMELFIQRELDRRRRIFPNDQLHQSPISKESFSNLPWAIERPRWWNPQAISSGTYIAIDNGFGPRIWIDANSSTLYYYDFS